MKKYIIFLPAAFILLLVSAVSCTNENNDTPPEPVKLTVGLVSGVGGFNDRGFNQLALMGLQRATSDLGFPSEGKESFDTSDIPVNINYFIQAGSDLIITLGYEAAQPTNSAATANPSKKFALLDYAATNMPANMLCYVFKVDQASFLCGFLGAYWAQFKDPAGPVAGWIGGADITEINNFKTGYLSGIQYFNTMYHKNVISKGFFADGFNDTLQGANLADSLIGLGADVIFPFAGKTGNGALYKIKEKGKWGIGVDLDQYVSIPEVSGILLTSCLKKMDNTVYNIIYYTATNGFLGKRTYYGTLGTFDVDIASYHDYDTQIPDSIKSAISTIRAGINNGTIPTGVIYK
jgi:basic membrane protein A and related proteins